MNLPLQMRPTVRDRLAWFGLREAQGVGEVRPSRNPWTATPCTVNNCDNGEKCWTCGGASICCDATDCTGLCLPPNGQGVYCNCTS